MATLKKNDRLKIKFSKGRIAAAVGLALLVFFVVRGRGPSGPVVVQVGEFKLTQKEAELYETALRARQANMSRATALNALITAFSRIQILKNVGVTINEEALDKEQKRLTPLMEKGGPLEKVRAVFKDDVKAFRKLYLMTGLAEKVIYQDYFLKHSPEQMEARKRADQFLEAFKKEPEAVRRLAEAEKLPAFLLTVSLTKGLKWEDLGAETPQQRKVASVKAPPGRAPRSAEGEFWNRRILSGMERGEVRETLQEFGDSWLAMRLIGPDPADRTAHRLEVVKIPQAPYDVWYRKQLAKVEVRKY